MPGYWVDSTRAEMQTPCMTGAMSAEQARAIYQLLDQNGVRCWVMGGWGVDALLGRVTRAHKDLDLLVQISDLPRYSEIVPSHGFDRKLEWSENRSKGGFHLGAVRSSRGLGGCARAVRAVRRPDWVVLLVVRGVAAEGCGYVRPSAATGR